ncbi:glutathione S-transferase family protein [Patulibacter sp.]|uniref:glutathione S-transferase family protein n=1 Tax=Patulibacter sp. TaxID=1912859 RepID=UPI002723DB5E|nr:glutathione S-transferase family protein [Patulibacter sp.]MDO9406944.1 glutathione S-transferase family protein [Patulibacter sp.]
MRLHHLPGSRSTRVLWTLEELGIDYDLHVMTGAERTGPEHRALHPLGRVPVLELDDGRHVFESAAICLHLADLHPDAGLAPPVGTSDRAALYQWLFFAMAELEPAVFGWMRATRGGTLQEVEAAAQHFATVAAVLRDVVSERRWMLGDTFTVADVLCSGPLGTAYRRGLADEDGPLREYVERAAARPANVRAESVRHPGAASARTTMPRGSRTR